MDKPVSGGAAPARQQQLLRVAQQLAAAAAAADWPALATVNTLLTATLPALAAQGPWTPAERAALAVLRQQHAAALQQVNAASTALGKQMQQMNTNKEGWLAYAFDNELAGTP
ncbi:hypothetical protein IP91_01712 [Pseudoduganella lurida]|uniref:Flagellar protein FliT n=1 Tax=Pseudoduganella lurida TaxID=1036180 RepID=A0A562REW0_9BURK|nr:hypothetical protein [Pseudoduganella lurida]TWI67595.1 hypothetical protein IP91_01712 [Pseudoduganella lurida]